jgi:hypothetical protein
MSSYFVTIVGRHQQPRSKPCLASELSANPRLMSRYEAQQILVSHPLGANHNLLGCAETTG